MKLLENEAVFEKYETWFKISASHSQILNFATRTFYIKLTSSYNLTENGQILGVLHILHTNFGLVQKGYFFVGGEGDISSTSNWKMLTQYIGVAKGLGAGNQHLHDINKQTIEQKGRERQTQKQQNYLQNTPTPNKSCVLFFCSLHSILFLWELNCYANIIYCYDNLCS